MCVLASSSPILNNDGFQELVVAINDDVPQDNGPALIQAIKVSNFGRKKKQCYFFLQDLLTETSEMMYLASMTKFYIKDVRILVPKHWDVPDEDRFGDIYEVNHKIG